MPGDMGHGVGHAGTNVRSHGRARRFPLWAAAIYRLMAGTPPATQTRETLDRSRTLEEALAVYAAHL